MSTTLADRFVAGTARITYTELTQRGGAITAWYKNGRYYHQHAADVAPHSEQMSTARAHAMATSDVRELAA